MKSITMGVTELRQLRKLFEEMDYYTYALSQNLRGIKRGFVAVHKKVNVRDVLVRLCSGKKAYFEIRPIKNGADTSGIKTVLWPHTLRKFLLVWTKTPLHYGKRRYSLEQLMSQWSWGDYKRDFCIKRKKKTKPRVPLVQSALATPVFRKSPYRKVTTRKSEFMG